MYLILYTDAELDKLLKRPTGDSFVEWRCWPAINTFLATGIRANTLVYIKISNVDFENDTIHLAKLKNRRQQFVPMSQSLKTALNIYLKLWDTSVEALCIGIASARSCRPAGQPHRAIGVLVLNQQTAYDKIAL